MKKSLIDKHIWLERFLAACLVVVLLTGSFPLQAAAMDAPGSGGANWHYRDTNHQWYYYPPGEEPHTGWLYYEGEWYWFDSNGCMTAGDYRTIDGLRYHFYGNGHMVWNQYIDLSYYDGDGQPDETHDIRIIGSTKPTSMDRDIITDSLYDVPRAWIRNFVDDGWQLMFYKKKSYFAAPSTDLGVYYVHHSVDTNYKKAKFTEAEAVLEAFGGYVWWAAGCNREDSVWMNGLWAEYNALQTLLELPNYYSDDPKFYFCKLFAAYVDSGQKEEVTQASPVAARIMDEILLSVEDEETRAREKAKEEERIQKEAEAEARRIELEGTGPGYSARSSQRR